MASPSSSPKSTAFQGLTIAYTTYNLPISKPSTPVLIFIHGWCCSAALWTPAQAALYTQHPSILIDLPGHGSSSNPSPSPESGIEYSADFFASAVQTVLEAENVSQAVFIGHSMGGFISTMLLRLLGPEKIKGIIYTTSFWFMPAHYLTSSQRSAWKDSLKNDETFFALFSTAFASAATPSSIISRVRKTMVEETPLHVRLNAGCTDSLPRQWRWDEVFADTPMLHITYAPNPPWDEQHKRHLPRLVTERWEGASIFLFMEMGERFNERVESFLKENGLA